MDRPAASIDGRRPHVHTQAVFVHRAAAGQRVADLGNHRAQRLPRTRAVFERIDDASPGLWSDGRLESIDAGGRGAVADSLERYDAFARATAKPARTSLDHRPWCSTLDAGTRR